MKRKCPVCGKIYDTYLEPPPYSLEASIQEVYPDAESWQREQLISGICSDACWEIWFPPDE